MKFEEFFAERDIVEAVEDDDLDYVYIVWHEQHTSTNELTAYLYSLGVDPLEYDLNKIYHSMYKGMNIPANFVIPEGTLYIETQAFCNCETLQELTIPASVRVIRSYAFANCTNLEKIVYQGTLEQWRKLDKRIGIFQGRQGKYITIQCTDKNYVYGEKV